MKLMNGSRPQRLALFGCMTAVLCWAALPEASGQYVAVTQSVVLPEDIVNLVGTVPHNGTVTAFTVPLNKWFILTDAEINAAFGDGIAIQEDLGGTVTTLRHAFFGNESWAYHSSVGLAFSPGSNVRLADLVGGQGSSSVYSLTGHLADP